MDAALKPDQVNALIKLIVSVAGGAEFTLSGHGELMRTWKKASDLLTPVISFLHYLSLYRAYRVISLKKLISRFHI